MRIKNLNKENISKMKLLSEDEIKKLDFFELSMYLDLLEEIESVLEGGDD